MPGQSESVPVSRGDADSVGLALVESVGIEAPEASVGLLKFGRVLAFGSDRIAPITVNVIGRADLDEDATLVVESENLGIMTFSAGRSRTTVWSSPLGTSSPGE